MRTKFAFQITAIVYLISQYANAGFPGDYSYFNYAHEFHGGIAPNIGETKTISIDHSDITIVSTNFQFFPREFSMNRTISNEFTDDPEPRCINNYSADLVTGTEPGGTGTVETAPYCVLNLHPADDPQNEFPFYFSRNTNVALNVSGSGEEFGIDFGLLVRKSSGMDNSFLNGTYIRYTLGNTTHISPTGNHDGLMFTRAVMEFDGTGYYNETTEEWSARRTTSETNLIIGSDTVVQTLSTLETESSSGMTNDTYSLLYDGMLLLSSEAGTVTNQLSPDENLWASVLALDMEPQFDTYLTVAVKQPDSMPTNAINAVYFLEEVSESFGPGFETDSIDENSVTLGRDYLFLSSNGTFEIRFDYWNLNNVIFNDVTDLDGGPGTNLVAQNIAQSFRSDKEIEFERGSYTIQTNGVITLHFSNSTTAEAQLSENGEYLLFGYSSAEDGEAERLLAIGIRRNPPPPMPSSVQINNITMTSTGAVITASLPANYPVEIISTTDLQEGSWESGGLHSSTNGTLQIADPDAADDAGRFYSATFAPW